MPEALIHAHLANRCVPPGTEAHGTENNIQSETMPVMSRRNGDHALA